MHFFYYDKVSFCSHILKLLPTHFAFFMPCFWIKTTSFAYAFISNNKKTKKFSSAPLQAFFHTSFHEYLIGEPRSLSEKNSWLKFMQGLDILWNVFTGKGFCFISTWRKGFSHKAVNKFSFYFSDMYQKKLTSFTKIYVDLFVISWFYSDTVIHIELRQRMS